MLGDILKRYKTLYLSLEEIKNFSFANNFTNYQNPRKPRIFGDLSYMIQDSKLSATRARPCAEIHRLLTNCFNKLSKEEMSCVRQLKHFILPFLVVLVRPSAAAHESIS